MEEGHERMEDPGKCAEERCSAEEARQSGTWMGGKWGRCRAKAAL